MKRIVPTIVEKAIQTVDGFLKVYKTMQQQVHLQGQSKSTLQNYIRRIALISLHYWRLPQEITEEEINEYLAALASNTIMLIYGAEPEWVVGLLPKVLFF